MERCKRLEPGQLRGLCWPVVPGCSALVNDRAAGDVDFGGSHGSGLVRRDERGHIADILKGCSPLQQRRLDETGHQLVTALEFLRDGLGDTAGLQGDHTDAAGADFARQLATESFESLQRDLKPPKSGITVPPLDPPNARITPEPCWSITAFLFSRSMTILLCCTIVTRGLGRVGSSCCTCAIESAANDDAFREQQHRLSSALKTKRSTGPITRESGE